MVQGPENPKFILETGQRLRIGGMIRFQHLGRAHRTGSRVTHAIHGGRSTGAKRAEDLVPVTEQRIS